MWYDILGYIDDQRKYSTLKNILGKIEDLAVVISGQTVDMVIVALPKSQIDYLDKIIPDVESYYLRNFNYSFLRDIPIVSVGIDKLSEPYWRFIKRIFDVSITILLAIIIFSWFFPLLLLFQKILNPGHLFYKSERWGKGGKLFWIYKIRTMRSTDSDKADETRQVPTDKNGNRVTRFGKFLRKTSLDELPQFFNVLKGEMSIVGPRPFDSKEAVLMKQILDNYMLRYYVRPGITGWAQISGYRGGTKDLSLMQKRVDVDN